MSCVRVRCTLPFLGRWLWWLCFGSLFPCLCRLCWCLLSGPFGFLILPLSLQDVILLAFRELNAEILYTRPMHFLYMGSPVNTGSFTVRGCIVSYPYVGPPYYGALFMGDGVSLPIPRQFGCDECILTHVTLYLNQKGGKSWAKLVGSSWYLTPLLWDTP